RAPFSPATNCAIPRRILSTLKVDIRGSRAAAVVLHVAVAPRGKGFPDRNSATGANLLEIVAAGFGVHAMVGSDKECRIGSGVHRLSEKFVQALQVLF